MSKRKAGTSNPVNLSLDIDEEQLSVLETIPDILPPGLKCIAPLLESIRKECSGVTLPPHRRSVPTKQATDFKSTPEAAKALKVDYAAKNPAYIFHLKQEELEPRKLSPHFAAVIDELSHSEYVGVRQDEAFCRTIIDLIILDRLKHLEDHSAAHRLQVSAEVPVSVRIRDVYGNDQLVRGRADWALGYGTTKSETGAILLMVEAKPNEAASVGMPQLLVYMAAVQDARRDRVNRTVFGMLTDSDEFRFAFLDEKRKLFVSRPLLWAIDQNLIITYIDNILIDAIESSPHTTPRKLHNRTIHNYRKALGRKWKFGDETDDEESEDDEEGGGEDDSWDVVQEGERVTMRQTTVVNRPAFSN